MKIHKLNTILYYVSKSLVEHKMDARVLPAKVIGYQSINGKVFPILKQGIREVNPETNYIFEDLKEAIEKLKFR